MNKLAGLLPISAIPAVAVLCLEIALGIRECHAQSHVFKAMNEQNLQGQSFSIMSQINDQRLAAGTLLRECLDIREAQQPNAWTTFNTISMWGGALPGQQKDADAKPLLMTGYDGMKQRESSIPPPSEIRLHESLDRLNSFYQLTENAEAERNWTSIPVSGELLVDWVIQDRLFVSALFEADEGQRRDDADCHADPRVGKDRQRDGH